MDFDIYLYLFFESKKGDNSYSRCLVFSFGMRDIFSSRHALSYAIKNSLDEFPLSTAKIATSAARRPVNIAL